MSLKTEAYLPVHSIESFGTHDGPGIRMVVFLQGCNIRCLYCHNPDTIPMQGGTNMSIQSIRDRAIRMKPYFAHSGGVTFSGGEPCIHAQTLIPLIEALKEEGIHTNIDTNGTVHSLHAQMLITKHADLVMFDIKASNNEQLLQITGAKNLERIIQTISLREQAKKPYWIRYVLLPGYTDSAKSIQWFIDQFRHAEYLEKVEILPYHTMGIHKWKQLGWHYSLSDINPPAEEQTEQIKTMLRSYFRSVQ